MGEQPLPPKPAAAAASPPQPPTPPGAKRQFFTIAPSWKVTGVVGAAMVLLAVLGAGLTTSEKSSAPTYWMCLVPVYGLLCVFVAWVRAWREGKPKWAAALRQVFHWLGIAAALWMLFFIQRSGEISDNGTGLVALLVMALGCFLAGIHLEWTFALVGMILVGTLILVDKVEQNWVVIALLGAGTLAAMLGLQWLVHRLHRRRPAAAATPVPAGHPGPAAGPGEPVRRTP